MSVQLGINGFGRIGRLMFRAAIANPQKYRVTAINDLNDIPYLVYLLKYDSVHGKYSAEKFLAIDLMTLTLLDAFVTFIKLYRNIFLKAVYHCISKDGKTLNA